MPLYYPVSSVLKTEYGPVDGKSIKEYYGVVHLGWYVVKATRVERYETLFTDYDEEGREARYVKFWKESHEDIAMVKRATIRNLAKERREVLRERLCRPCRNAEQRLENPWAGLK